eukprot:GHRR01003096.1.p1 GENE.GHRR01003096.1~~GHRR01003096.1.p1  ORF type:complete len:189 (+),score=51.36 GHRR01003096.1:93-659(+)
MLGPCGLCRPYRGLASSTAIVYNHHAVRCTALRVTPHHRGDAADVTSQQITGADVQRLEETYRQSAASNDDLAGVWDPQQQQQHQQTAEQQWQEQWRSQLQARYVTDVLPVARAVHAAEQRLEAALPSVGNAVLLMVAFILYDYGWNNILDRLLGNSPLGSICCIMTGLGMILGVRLMGHKPLDFWRN